MASNDLTTRPSDEPDAVVRYTEGVDGILDVHLPPRGPGEAQQRPLLLYVHGGFWRQATDRTHARPLANALAQLGHVVAVPEYRRVGGAGGWPTTAQDVDLALTRAPELLAGIGVPTTGPVVVVGHSAGGHLALWLAGQPGHDVSRVVALAPVGDLRQAAATGMGDGAITDFLGGTPDELPQAYDAADPATRFATRPSCEVVVVHGDADDAVPIANTRGLAERHPWIDHRELPGVDHMAVIDPLSDAWPAVLAAIRDPPRRPVTCSALSPACRGVRDGSAQIGLGTTRRTPRRAPILGR